MKWYSNHNRPLCAGPLTDGSQKPLADVRRMTRTPDGYELESHSGDHLRRRSLQGLPTQFRVGDQDVTVDLTRATDLFIAPPSDGVGVIRYSVVVLDGETELYRDSGKLILEGDAMLPDITGTSWVSLGGESPFPQFLEPNADAFYERKGLRSKERNYVQSRASNLLAGDFTSESDLSNGPRSPSNKPSERKGIASGVRTNVVP